MQGRILTHKHVLLHSRLFLTLWDDRCATLVRPAQYDLGKGELILLCDLLDGRVGEERRFAPASKRSPGCEMDAFIAAVFQ